MNENLAFFPASWCLDANPKFLLCAYTCINHCYYQHAEILCIYMIGAVPAHFPFYTIDEILKIALKF